MCGSGWRSLNSVTAAWTLAIQSSASTSLSASRSHVRSGLCCEKARPGPARGVSRKRCVRRGEKGGLAPTDARTRAGHHSGDVTAGTG